MSTHHTLFTLALGLLPGLALVLVMTEPGLTAANYDESKVPPFTLPDLLTDRDPWVRYSAYRALTQATGLDHFADWFYGEASELKAAKALWKDAVKKGS